MTTHSNQFGFETNSIHAGTFKDSQFHSASTPIYAASTFIHQKFDDTLPYAYSRFSNPTRDALQDTILSLEGASTAIATTSGNAAIFLTMSLLKSGDHLIYSKYVHGGTQQIASSYLANFGIQSSSIDTTDLSAVQSAIQPNTKLIWIETPSNPFLYISDIQKIHQLIANRPITLAVDNTLLSPYFQKPLSLGADIVVHSATKYLNGHSDVLAGLVLTKDPSLGQKLQSLSTILGLALSPFDSWLVLRSLKTLAIRMQAHEKNANLIAHFLHNHPLVANVFYPGLPSHPQHPLALQQQSGFGGMIFFYLKKNASISAFFNHLKLFKFAFSLGGVESLISHPWSKSHHCVPENLRIQMGVTPELIRLSVGIENSDDLIQDLSSALHASVIQSKLT